MSFNGRKKRFQERAAKFLHDLVFNYTYESICKNKDGVLSFLNKEEEEELYKRKRQEWFDYCKRINKEAKGIIVLQDHAFKTMVDNRFIDIAKSLSPKIKFIKLWQLKRRKHSYA